MVTISATYGSGGAVIGPLLADRLGLPFADRLVHMPAGRPTSERASDAELDEEPRSAFVQGLALLGATTNLPVSREAADLPDRLRSDLQASLDDLLRGGGAVVLGRAAAIVLGPRPDAFHVRLDGAKDRRARRGAVWEGTDEPTALRQLEETDGARARYVHRLYGVDAADPSLYDMVLDATRFSVNDCTELIADAAERFWRYDDASLAESAATARARLAALRDR
jgi:cytidylate kinase